MLFIWFLKMYQILQNKRQARRNRYAETFRAQYLLTQHYKVTPVIRGWNTKPMRRGWENWASLVENNSQRPWENPTAFQNPRGVYLEDSLKCMGGKKPRDNDYKLKQGQLWLEIRRKFFTMRIINLWAGCPERPWNLHPYRFSWSSWTKP